MTVPSILITGACSNIGRAITRNFAKSNKLIIHGTNEQRLTRLLDQLPNREDHTTWLCDFETIESVSPSLEALLDKSERCISGIIHCAGKSPSMHSRLLTQDTISRLFNVNTFSAFAIISSLLKQKNQRATLTRIVFISSLASTLGVKGFAAYSATKGANDSFMRSLAMELAPRVQCASVVLGPISQTSSTEKFEQDRIQSALGNRIPLGEGQVNDVVGVVEFLFSSNSRWITGQSIVVDGGQSVNGSIT